MARVALIVAASVALMLLIWSLASCTEPQPDCEAPWFMINSTLTCPAQHYEPQHYGQH